MTERELHTGDAYIPDNQSSPAFDEDATVNLRPVGSLVPPLPDPVPCDVASPAPVFESFTAAPGVVSVDDGVSAEVQDGEDIEGGEVGVAVPEGEPALVDAVVTDGPNVEGGPCVEAAPAVSVEEGAAHEVAPDGGVPSVADSAPDAPESDASEITPGEEGGVGESPVTEAGASDISSGDGVTPVADVPETVATEAPLDGDAPLAGEATPEDEPIVSDHTEASDAGTCDPESIPVEVTGEAAVSAGEDPAVSVEACAPSGDSDVASGSGTVPVDAPSESIPDASDPDEGASEVSASGAHPSIHMVAGPSPSDCVAQAEDEDDFATNRFGVKEEQPVEAVPQYIPEDGPIFLLILSDYPEPGSNASGVPFWGDGHVGKMIMRALQANGFTDQETVDRSVVPVDDLLRAGHVPNIKGAMLTYVSNRHGADRKCLIENVLERRNFDRLVSFLSTALGRCPLDRVRHLRVVALGSVAKAVFRNISYEVPTEFSVKTLLNPSMEIHKANFSMDAWVEWAQTAMKTEERPTW